MIALRGDLAAGQLDRVEDLLEGVRRGDAADVERLFRLYEGSVFHLARRVCASSEDAEEVLQETFLEVLRSLNGYRGEGSLWGWIRRIAVNKALTRLRRERVRATEPLGTPDGDDWPARDGSGAPGQRIDLEQALDLLGDTARAVVWLYDVEGYTHEEIAESMGRSVSFSKSQLSRAHARLRVWLEPGGGHPSRGDGRGGAR